MLLSTAARNASADAVVDLLDVGTTDASGDILFTTGSDVAVANTALSNPAFGASSNGVATANAITSDTNATGGTTTRAQFRNRNNTEVFRVSVGISGAEINLTSNVVPPGGTVQLTAATYTQPAGTAPA